MPGRKRISSFFLIMGIMCLGLLYGGVLPAQIFGDELNDLQSELRDIFSTMEGARKDSGETPEAEPNVILSLVCLEDPGRLVSEVSISSGRNKTRPDVDWARGIYVDGRPIFGEKYTSVYSDSVIGLRLEEGVHIIEPGGHRFVLSEGKILPQSPYLVASGKDLRFLLYPVTFKARNRSSFSSGPMLIRNDLRILLGDIIVYKAVDEFFLRPYEPRTVYLPPNGASEPYTVAPGEFQFWLDDGKVSLIGIRGESVPVEELVKHVDIDRLTVTIDSYRISLGVYNPENGRTAAEFEFWYLGCDTECNILTWRSSLAPFSLFTSMHSSDTVFSERIPGTYILDIMDVLWNPAGYRFTARGPDGREVYLDISPDFDEFPNRYLIGSSKAIGDDPGNVRVGEFALSREFAMPGEEIQARVTFFGKEKQTRNFEAIIPKLNPRWADPVALKLSPQKLCRILNAIGGVQDPARAFVERIQAARGGIVSTGNYSIPRIISVGEPGEGEEGLLLFGENFTNDAKVWLFYPRAGGIAPGEFPVTPPEGAILTRPLRDTGNAQMIRIPGNGEEVGMSSLDRSLTMIWVETAAGLSSPYFYPGPEISVITEGIEQGGTFVLFGERLTEDAKIWIWQPDPDGRKVYELGKLREVSAAADDFSKIPEPPPFPPRDAFEGQVVGDISNPQVRMVRLGRPGKGPDWDDNRVPTVVWVQTEAGWSAPYVFNKPELWFASDNKVVPGERVRLMGRNLYGYTYNPGIRLVCLTNEETGEIFWGETFLRYGQEHPNVRQHELDFRVPSDVPPGPYSVRVHNLSGGVYGWSNSLPLRIIKSRDFLGQMARIDDSSNAIPIQMSSEPPLVIKVEGAKGDGISDDTEVIQGAINKADRSGGGVVVLPPGTYAISKTLELKEGVVLKGQGQGATKITVSPLRPMITSRKTKAMIPMVLMRNKTGLEDLSIVAGPGADINVLIQDSKLMEDVFVKRCLIENTHAYLSNLTAGLPYGEQESFGIRIDTPTEGLVLFRNRIIAPNTLSGVNLRHAKIVGNYFETYPHNYHDNVFLCRISESIFEDNVMAYGRRAFTSQGGMWRNLVAENNAVDIRGVANGSEMYMSEYGGNLLYGGVSSATLSTIMLGEDIADLRSIGGIDSGEYYAFILAGRGIGQYRRIIGLTDEGLELETPWRVVPDTTSKVSIMAMATQNLFLNNSASDTRGHLQFFWGSAADNVITGCESRSSGIVTHATYEDETRFGVLAFNSLCNNRLVGNGGIVLGTGAGPDVSNGKAFVFANTVVRNQVWSARSPGWDNQYYAFWNWVDRFNPDHAAAISLHGGLYNVIENNFINDSKIGIFINGGYGNAVFWNRVEDTERPVNDKGRFTLIEPPAYQF